MSITCYDVNKTSMTIVRPTTLLLFNFNMTVMFCRRNFGQLLLVDRGPWTGLTLQSTVAVDRWATSNNMKMMHWPLIGSLSSGLTTMHWQLIGRMPYLGLTP